MYRTNMEHPQFHIWPKIVILLILELDQNQSSDILFRSQFYVWHNIVHQVGRWNIHQFHVNGGLEICLGVNLNNIVGGRRASNGPRMGPPPHWSPHSQKYIWQAVREKSPANVSWENWKMCQMNLNNNNWKRGFYLWKYKRFRRILVRICFMLYQTFIYPSASNSWTI